MRTAAPRALRRAGAPAERAAPARSAGELSPRSAAQLRRASSLNDGARVRRQQDRAALVQRRSASGGVIQRDALDWGSGATGAAALGTVGWYVGGLPGALLGGAIGAIGGYLGNRLAFTRDLWSEANQPSKGYRTWSSPATMADQLASSSRAFRDLRASADEATRESHGRPLLYGTLPARTAAAHPAAFANGQVSVDPDNHPSIALQNLPFETANAVVAPFFARVRADHGRGQLGDLAAYGRLLRRDPDELGERLRSEYEDGDPVFKRSLLQEWGEWQSLELARPSLEDVGARLRSDTAKDYWDIGFGARLAARDFREYYENFGEDHRQAVESNLRRAAQ